MAMVNDDVQATVRELLHRVQELEQSQTHRTLIASFDDGDIAWMLAATALVLFMTLPGLFLFYGGMARTKNVLAIVMQIFSTACSISLLWMVFGYSLAFAPAQGSNPQAVVFGDSSRFWLINLTLDSVHQLAPSLPESIFCTFQMAFAIITPCLMVGAFADRMKFVSTLLFMGIWHLLVYCPIAHSVWHPDGFLFSSGALDYAGGLVVHVTSGISGLIGCIYLGPRKGFATERFDPHNVLLTAVGASMLWVGWLGFNAGSALAANDRAAMACLVTQIATAMAALTWMATEWMHLGQPTVQGIVSGAVAGLVAITPGSGYVDHTAAFFIGLLTGPVCYWAVQAKHWAGYDDALDAFGVHGVGGILGSLLLAFFANPSIASNANGIFYTGKAHLLGSQLYGIVVAAGWAAVVTAAILFVVDKIVGLRVSEEVEHRGLDHSQHGQTLAATLGIDQTTHVAVDPDSSA